MRKQMYCVRDSKVGWMMPFEDINDASAMRGFLYSVSQNPGIIGFAPADYSLYRIGEFDTQSGIFANLDNNIYICSGSDALNFNKEVSHEELEG